MKNLFIFCALLNLLCLASCTISMTNASSVGKSSDLVDENQTASPDVKTDLSVPLIK